MRSSKLARPFMLSVTAFALVVGTWAAWTKEVVVAQSENNRKVAVLDNCDPNDPGWAPTGGCLLSSKLGNVSFAEFGQLLLSPLTINPVVVGHPSWRNEPSYLTLKFGKSLRVTNEGGRLHTFTEVAQFGGGRIPPLAVGLLPAPACALAPGATDPTAIAPGQSLEVTGLTPGLHKFQCCIHSWMHAAVRVEQP